MTKEELDAIQDAAFIYQPVLSDVERRAYQAAHRLLSENTNAPEKACPGARRTHAIDTIARVIINSFSAQANES